MHNARDGRTSAGGFDSKALASELGVNPAQVRRWAEAGMPRDVVGARAWMQANATERPQCKIASTAATSTPRRKSAPDA